MGRKTRANDPAQPDLWQPVDLVKKWPPPQPPPPGKEERKRLCDEVIALWRRAQLRVTEGEF
jgi:hypothetical protein